MKCQLHAVLMRIFDSGVLLIGESGIGKSECALDLITKGHQLVADDAVAIIIAEGVAIGRAPELTRHLIEIRGLGIMNVAHIFGESATCKESRIDLCIELRDGTDAERLADPITPYDLAGVAIPKLTIPVRPGRNLGTLIETAVRLHLNRGSGSAADALVMRHESLLNKAS